MLEFLVAAFLVPIAINDALWRSVPKIYTVTAAAAGLLFHAVYGGFGSALFAMIAGFVVGMIFYGLGAIGGGDVKVIAAVGALLGWNNWLVAMEVAIFAAALVALAQVLYRGALLQTLRNMGVLVMSWAHGGIHPVINVKNPKAIRSPFAVSAAVGAFVALLLH